MNQNVWPGIPYPAFLTAAGVVLMSVAFLGGVRYFDPSGGPLSLSVLVVIAFVAATFGSMIYDIPQTPSTDMLVGGLATALGGVIAFWLGRSKGPPP